MRRSLFAILSGALFLVTGLLLSLSVPYWTRQLFQETFSTGVEPTSGALADMTVLLTLTAVSLAAGSILVIVGAVAHGPSTAKPGRTPPADATAALLRMRRGSRAAVAVVAVGLVVGASVFSMVGYAPTESRYSASLAVTPSPCGAGGGTDWNLTPPRGAVMVVSWNSSGGTWPVTLEILDPKTGDPANFLDYGPMSFPGSLSPGIGTSGWGTYVASGATYEFAAYPAAGDLPLQNCADIQNTTVALEVWTISSPMITQGWTCGAQGCSY